MNKKIMSALIISGVLLNVSPNIYALTRSDVYDEILNNYSYRIDELEKIEYLNKLGIKTEEYIELLESLDNYKDSNIEKWWLIETNRLFFEDIIFNIKQIKAIYEEKINVYGQNEKVARWNTKRELMSSIEKLKGTYDSLVINSDYNVDIFKKYFNRAPSEKEKLWMNNLNTFKYALYSGVLGREINQNEINLIENGKSYELLNINIKEKQDYENLIERHDKVEQKEVLYYRTIESMNRIKDLVLQHYSIDIFESIFIEDRERIHLESTTNYKYNERDALALVIEYLEDKGYIKDDEMSWVDEIIKPGVDSDIPSVIPPIINDDFGIGGPISDIKNNFINDYIYKSITSSVKSLYGKSKYNMSEGEYVFFKYNDIEFNTNIKIDIEEELNVLQSKAILNSIVKNLSGKMVSSKTKTLLLVNNKMTIIDYKKSSNQKIKFEDLKVSVGKTEIDVYVKYYKPSN